MSAPHPLPLPAETAEKALQRIREAIRATVPSYSAGAGLMVAVLMLEKAARAEGRREGIEAAREQAA